MPPMVGMWYIHPGRLYPGITRRFTTQGGYTRVYNGISPREAIPGYITGIYTREAIPGLYT